MPGRLNTVAGVDNGTGMAILIELVRKCEKIYCFVMGFLSQSPDVWMFPVNFPIFEDSLRQICRSTIQLDGILVS